MNQRNYFIKTVSYSALRFKTKSPADVRELKMGRNGRTDHFCFWETCECSRLSQNGRTDQAIECDGIKVQNIHHRTNQSIASIKRNHEQLLSWEP